MVSLEGIESFDEQSNGAAAREPDREGIVIAVAEGDDAGRCLAVKDGQRLGNDSAFHAPSTDAAGNLAGFTDGHRSTGQARAGALDVDNARDRDPCASGPPAVDVVEQFSHRVPIRAAGDWRRGGADAITAANSCIAAMLCPSTNASTYGRAAAIPRASGA